MAAVESRLKEESKTIEYPSQAHARAKVSLPQPNHLLILLPIARNIIGSIFATECGFWNTVLLYDTSQPLPTPTPSLKLAYLSCSSLQIHQFPSPSFVADVPFPNPAKIWLYFNKTDVCSSYSSHAPRNCNQLISLRHWLTRFMIASRSACFSGAAEEPRCWIVRAHDLKFPIDQSGNAQS